MSLSRYLESEIEHISSMFKAVEIGDLNAAERLVKKYGENFRNDRYRGYKIMYEAMKSRKLDVARFLLNCGAAVNTERENRLLPNDEYKLTLLQLALIHEDIELFKILLIKGCDVDDHGGEDEETALHTAVRLNQLEVVKLLLEHKSDINSVDKDDRTPLLTSIEAKTDSLPMLQILFEYKPNPRLYRQIKYKLLNVALQVDYGLDALSYAVIFKRTDTIIYLLEHGADINLIHSYCWTPLVVASMLGYEDMCRLLIDRGCDINLPGGREETPLHHACAHNRDKIVKLLLTSGSNYNANTVGWTPLHAIFSRRTSFDDCSIFLEPQNYNNVFHTLLDYDVDLNACIKHDKLDGILSLTVPVHDVCVNGSVITPLHVAVSKYLKYVAVSKYLKYGHIDPIFMELLLEYGADVNMLDGSMCSPLYYAVERVNDHLFSFLICYGADVSQRCNRRTPLSAVRQVSDLPYPRNKAMYMTAIKWKTLGLATIPDENFTSLHPDDLTFFKTFEQQCQSELDDINNFNSSLYLLLTKPINDIPYLAEHKIMDDICCNTMEDRFPLYQSIISLRLRRVRFRFSLLQQCKDFRDWLDGFLPDCATLIVSYLGNRDLRKLSTW